MSEEHRHTLKVGVSRRRVPCLNPKRKPYLHNGSKQGGRRERSGFRLPVHNIVINIIYTKFETLRLFRERVQTTLRPALVQGATKLRCPSHLVHIAAEVAALADPVFRLRSVARAARSAPQRRLRHLPWKYRHTRVTAPNIDLGSSKTCPRNMVKIIRGDNLSC
jgi:hypothetical protein